MTRKEKIAWAAGFVDGEGCITIQKSYAPSKQGWHAMSLMMRVTQKRRQPLDALASLFGGSAEPMKSRPYFDWTISAVQTANALREMLPYLILKRDQAELALEFYELQQERASSTVLSEEDRMVREFCYTELKALKVAA